MEGPGVQFSTADCRMTMNRTPHIQKDIKIHDQGLLQHDDPL